ncbi:GGDEF domain-containing protein [Marinobacterium weihaiense]|uniref:diguanylate cyclase n=1 Tax=Marinobacterium weihaiense TaxID=2851016 RepID=A0ABS6M6S6_9GAMM|nr:GGDEF domain-containing protein [Marinobacterium weihaiense]MBV0931989.1 GGDEF domain-containing protein [Marinobacterium weihaiense]
MTRKTALRLLLLLLIPLPLLLPTNRTLWAAEYMLFIVSLPWLFGGIVALLATGFKQSRLLLHALHLAAASGLLQLIGNAGLNHPAAYVALVFTGLIWPVIQLWILWRPGCNVWSRCNAMRALFVLAPYVALSLLLQYQPLLLATALPRLPAACIEFFMAGTSISKGVFWWQLMVLSLTLALSVLKRHPDILPCLSLNLIMLAALFSVDNNLHSALLHLLGQALLLAALIEHGYAMAFVDALTGIPARRALEHQLINPGAKYGIAMLDVDHFKQFNDRYGHDTGDQVLRMVAAQVQRIGAGGRAFRYGGEEFTVVFRRGSPQAALEALETLREAIAVYPLTIRTPNRPKDNQAGRQQRNRHNETETVHVTISIGFCWHQGETTPDAVIKRADEALYEAKRSGRNCLRQAGQNTHKQKRRSRNDFARKR